MKRILVVFLAGAVLVGSLGAQVTPQRLKDLGLGVADTPLDPIEFELRNLAGAPVKLSEMKGKVVFLNFWATWCGPCRAEMPSMERMYRQLKGEGLEILAVNLAEDKGQVQRFAKERKLSFPIVLDTSGRVGGQYDARAIPTTYLLDRRSLVFARAVGGREWDEPEMIDVLRAILRDGIGF